MTTSDVQTATVYDYLQGDHRRLDDLMETCRGSVAKGDIAAAATAFGAFREGLLRHIRIEEEMLFPVFDSESGLAGSGPTAVMRHEHVEIQRLLESMRELLAGGNAAAEFEPLRSALVALLSNHNMKEERILYPMTDRMLAPPKRAELVRRMREF